MGADAWFSSVLLVAIGIFLGGVFFECHQRRMAILIWLAFSAPLLSRLFILATLY